MPKYNEVLLSVKVFMCSGGGNVLVFDKGAEDEMVISPAPAERIQYPFPGSNVSA